MLREGHQFGVVENRIIRSIYVPEMPELTGGWKKMVYLGCL
jgi:hypothetical protein